MDFCFCAVVVIANILFCWTLFSLQTENCNGEDKPIHKNRCLRKGTNKRQCMFCRDSNESEWECGALKAQGRIVVHEFCLLFASDLQQKDDFDETTDPLVGFTPHGIDKCYGKAKNQKCTFCGTSRATIQCSTEGCKNRFHLPCGRKAGSFHRFYDRFDSYCLDHIPPTLSTERLSNVDLDHLPKPCGVCLETFSGTASLREIIVTSCCVNGVFHWDCIQGYAIKAGKHHLFCPMCKDADIYQRDLLESGIFIPDRDAEWERGDQFADHLRPPPCCASTCQCPTGRDFFNKDSDGEWRLVKCDTCGSQALHLECMEAIGLSGSDTSSWTCDDCRPQPEPAPEQRQKRRMSRQVLEKRRSKPKLDAVIETTREGTIDQSVINEDNDSEEEYVSIFENRSVATSNRSRSIDNLRPSQSRLIASDRDQCMSLRLSASSINGSLTSRNERRSACEIEIDLTEDQGDDETIRLDVSTTNASMDVVEQASTSSFRAISTDMTSVPGTSGDQEEEEIITLDDSLSEIRFENAVYPNDDQGKPKSPDLEALSDIEIIEEVPAGASARIKKPKKKRETKSNGSKRPDSDDDVVEIPKDIRFGKDIGEMCRSDIIYRIRYDGY